MEKMKSGNIDTNFWKAIITLIESLSNSIEKKLDIPVRAYMAGGSAFHYYTKERVSRDADLSFSHRVIIPQGMMEFYYDNVDHIEKSVTIDSQYHNALGLMHPNYQEDATPIGLLGTNKNIDLYVISPVDLAVSKLLRFSERDESDIKVLAGLKLFSKEEFIIRAKESMDYAVGNMSLANFAVDKISEYFDILRANEFKP